jgi:hypothetical protein
MITNIQPMLHRRFEINTIAVTNMGSRTIFQSIFTQNNILQVLNCKLVAPSAPRHLSNAKKEALKKQRIADYSIIYALNSS